MSRVLTEPAPAGVRVAPAARVLLVGVIGAALIALGAVMVREPGFVDRVSIVNDTGYDLAVDVTGSDRDGWLPISVATTGAVSRIEQVVDQGDTWIFRFRHSGNTVGELRVSRDALRRAGWRIEVPDEVGERLGVLGAEPSSAPS